jgi:peroxiredoxin
MKTLSPLSIAGLLLAALGLGLAYSDLPLAGPLVSLAGVYLAQRGIGHSASVPRFWILLAASGLAGAAHGLVLQPLLGLGLALVLLGHFVRTPFVPRLGVTGAYWIDPLLAYPGFAVLCLGAWRSASWFALPAALFAADHVRVITLGFILAVKMRAKVRGGYGATVGLPAPEFTLSDEQGFPVSLASFKGRSHVLLIFVRGDWCPSCHITLRTYARHKDQFQDQGVTLMAIGPDPLGVNLRMVKELGVPYKMLSDEGQRTAMAYGVQIGDSFTKHVMPDGVPLPASFLVDRQGVVRYTSRPERAGEFLDPRTLFPVLQGLAA